MIDEKAFQRAQRRILVLGRFNADPFPRAGDWWRNPEGGADGKQAGPLLWRFVPPRHGEAGRTAVPASRADREQLIYETLLPGFHEEAEYLDLFLSTGRKQTPYTRARIAAGERSAGSSPQNFVPLFPGSPLMNPELRRGYPLLRSIGQASDTFLKFEADGGFEDLIRRFTSYCSRNAMYVLDGEPRPIPLWLKKYEKVTAPVAVWLLNALFAAGDSYEFPERVQAEMQAYGQKARWNEADARILRELILEFRRIELSGSTSLKPLDLNRVLNPQILVKPPKTATTTDDFLEARRALNLVSQLLQSNIALGYIARWLFTGDHVRNSEDYDKHQKLALEHGVDARMVHDRKAKFELLEKTIKQLAAEQKLPPADEQRLVGHLLSQLPSKAFGLKQIRAKVSELELELARRVDKKGEGEREKLVESYLKVLELESVEKHRTLTLALPEGKPDLAAVTLNLAGITLIVDPGKKLVELSGWLTAPDAREKIKADLKAQSRSDLDGLVDAAFDKGSWGFGQAAMDEARKELGPHVKTGAEGLRAPELSGFSKVSGALAAASEDAGAAAPDGGSKTLDQVLNDSSPAIQHATTALVKRADQLSVVPGADVSEKELEEFYDTRDRVLDTFLASRAESPDTRSPFCPLVRQHFLAMVMLHVHRGLPLRLAEDLGNLCGLLLDVVGLWRDKDASEAAFFRRLYSGSSKPLSTYFDIATEADFAQYEDHLSTQCWYAEQDTRDLCDDVQGASWLLDALASDAGPVPAEVDFANMTAQEFVEAPWPIELSDPITLQGGNAVRDKQSFLPCAVLVTRSAQRWRKKGSSQTGKQQFPLQQFLSDLDNKWREHGGRGVVPPTFIVTPWEADRQKAVDKVEEFAKVIQGANLGFPAFALGPAMATQSRPSGDPNSPYYFAAALAGIKQAAPSVVVTETTLTTKRPVADEPQAGSAQARFPATAVLLTTDANETTEALGIALKAGSPLGAHLFAYQVSVILRSAMASTPDAKVAMPKTRDCQATVLKVFQSLVRKQKDGADRNALESLGEALRKALSGGKASEWAFTQQPDQLQDKPIKLDWNVFAAQPRVVRWGSGTAEVTLLTWLATLLASFAP